MYVCAMEEVEEGTSAKKRVTKKRSESTSSLLLRLSLSLEHVLDDLGLLDEEGTHDAHAHASRASRTTVSTRNRLLTLRDGAVLARAVRLDAAQVRVAVTALGDSAALLNVQVSQVSTRRLDDLSASRLGVVGVALAEGDTLSHLVVGLKFAQDRQQE